MSLDAWPDLNPLATQLKREVAVHRQTPAADAFARLRVSDPLTLFDSSLQYDLQPTQWLSVLTGAGTASHVANQSACAMAVGTASGDKVVRQSRPYIRYRPGKSHLILLTGVLGAGKTNVRQRIGYFDDANGVFFERTASALSVVVRTYTGGSASDTAVASTSWNLDKMDGTGPSGKTLDTSKANIYLMDIEWLGVGRVRFGVVIDGAIYYVHEVLNANALTTVYMQTACLPCRYEIENTGTAASGTTMYQICASVMSEGGDSPSGSAYAVANGTTTISVSTRRAVLSIRPKATFASVTNRAEILLRSVDLYIASAASNNAYWELVKGGTLGGSPSWTSANTNSAVEFDVAGTTVTGGSVLAAGYDKPSGTGAVDLSALGRSDIGLWLDAAGSNPDVLSVVLTSMSGTITAGAAVGWFESK